MYDPTFGPKSLERHLRKEDFKHNTAAPTTNTEREAAIAAAVSVARDGLAAMSLPKFDHAGRDIFQVDDLPTKLVLRKAAQNLRRIAYAEQSNRLDIVRRLRLLCEEGMSFCIGKFDIAKFYQSVDHIALKLIIQRRLSTSPSTVSVLMSFIDRCAELQIAGLPPGLEISASLSEFYMQDFDRSIRKTIRPYFYARYVDDLIIVLPPLSDIPNLRREIIHALPAGLQLNTGKSRILRFNEDKKKVPKIEGRFDYLGFEFRIHETNKKLLARHVEIDIAQSKIKKRKSRMTKCALQYLKDRNFNDLRDRLKIITCNYRYFDYKRSKYLLAGNRHSYGLIDLPSNALCELDTFQKKLILQSNGKISARLVNALSNAQKKQLLRLSSTKGFEKKIYFHFPPSRLKELVDCWKYA